MGTKLKDKRVWTVSDFAELAGLSHVPARRLLLKIDAKHRGRLLTRSEGTNRMYTFRPATLRRLEPEYFEPVESLEFRVEELEEGLATVTAALRRVATQVGAHTRQLMTLLEAAARATSRPAQPASGPRPAVLRRAG